MRHYEGTITVLDTGKTFRAEWRGHAAECEGNPGTAALDVAAAALGDAKHVVRKARPDEDNNPRYTVLTEKDD